MVGDTKTELYTPHKHTHKERERERKKEKYIKLVKKRHNILPINKTRKYHPGAQSEGIRTVGGKFALYLS